MIEYVCRATMSRDWGRVLLHRVCSCWIFKAVRTGWRILGPVIGSRSGIHHMSSELAVVRMRGVTTRRSRC